VEGNAEARQEPAKLMAILERVAQLRVATNNDLAGARPLMERSLRLQAASRGAPAPDFSWWPDAIDFDGG